MKATIRYLRDLNLASLTRRGNLLLALVCFSVYLFLCVTPLFAMSVEDEVKAGRQLAARIEKHYQVVTDPEVVAQVTLVGNRLQKAIRKLPYSFHFIVIKDKDVNAFAILGGYVFVTTKLLEWVRSQDELAAVLAHEMSHCLLRHPIKQAANNERLSLYALLIAVVVKKPSVAFFSNLLKISFLTHYSREFEKQADLKAIDIMVSAGYDPVGLLTVMERFRAQYMKHDHPDLGILQTHPSFTDRIKYIKEKIKALGIPINRRKTARVLVVSGSVVKESGRFYADLLLDNKVLFSLPFNSKATAEERLKCWKEELDGALRVDVEPYEIVVSSERGEALLKIRSHVALKVSNADTKLGKENPYSLLRGVRKKILMAINRVRLRVPIY